MELTGKCKKEFEKWYKLQKMEIEYVINVDGETDIYKIDVPQFYQHPDSMKYGVYVDFFDSAGILVDTIGIMENTMIILSISLPVWFNVIPPMVATISI